MVTRQSCEEMGLIVGDTITAVIKATAVHLVSRSPAIVK
ncbi:MAG: TOBE domain-containing protein [Terriglobia bacterium]